MIHVTLYVSEVMVDMADVTFASWRRLFRKFYFGAMLADHVSGPRYAHLNDT